MKHNYINRIAYAILLSFFACVIVQAEPKVSRINADIHYTDGNVVYVENLDLPYGNIFSKARYITYSKINEKDKVEKVELESEPMDYIVCWNAANPTKKYKFEKVRITDKGHKYWCVLDSEGENGKALCKADSYKIDENGELTLIYREGSGTFTLNTLFLFEGDEYASMCPGAPINWARWARGVFPGDKQMIKNIREGKYNKDDLQVILDTYIRPEPLKCKKIRND